ncbi:MAG: hypothetical protein NC453_14840 [Muribaculum sp.]|nr:hypothetical protein [Muribaculum sp.]
MKTISNQLILTPTNKRSKKKPVVGKILTAITAIRNQFIPWPPTPAA